MYSCTTSALSYETGSFSVRGDVLTVERKSGTFRSENTCGTASQKSLQPETRSYRWRVGSDDLGVQILWLTRPSGEESAYRKVP